MLHILIIAFKKGLSNSRWKIIFNGLKQKGYKCNEKSVDFKSVLTDNKIYTACANIMQVKYDNSCTKGIEILDRDTAKQMGTEIVLDVAVTQAADALKEHGLNVIYKLI